MPVSGSPSFSEGAIIMPLFCYVDEILAGADQCDVVFLVVGDPLG